MLSLSVYTQLQLPLLQKHTSFRFHFPPFSPFIDVSPLPDHSIALMVVLNRVHSL